MVAAESHRLPYPPGEHNQITQGPEDGEVKTRSPEGQGREERFHQTRNPLKRGREVTSLGLPGRGGEGKADIAVLRIAA
jgi:hypothetical protein